MSASFSASFSIDEPRLDSSTPFMHETAPEAGPKGPPAASGRLPDAGSGAPRLDLLVQEAARAVALAEPDRARDLYHQILRHAPAGTPEREHALASLAALHEETGEIELSGLLARRVLEDPDRPPSAARAGALTHLLARLESRCGRPGRALDLVAEMARVDPDGARIANVELLLDWGDAAWAQEVWDTARDQRKHPSSAGLGAAALACARLALARGRPVAAREAASWLSRCRDPELEAWGWLLSAELALAAGAPGRAAGLCRASSHAARASGRRTLLARVRLLQGRVEAATGRRARAHRAACAALAIARRTRHRLLQIVARLLLSELAGGDGDPMEALRHADGALLLCPRRPVTALRQEALLRVGAALAVRPDPEAGPTGPLAASGRLPADGPDPADRAVPVAAPAVGATDDSGPLLPPRLALLRARILVDAGSPDEARRLVGHVVDSEALAETGLSAADLGGLALAAGRPDDVLRIVAIAPPPARADLRCRLAGAVALALSGRPDAALARLERAPQDPAACAAHHRARELVLAGAWRRAEAAVEREAWIRAGRRAAREAVWWIGASGLDGPRSLRLVDVRSTAWRLSDVASELLLPGPRLELVVDRVRRRALLARDRTVDLSRHAVLFDMLLFLAQHAGRTFSYRELYEAFWRTSYDPHIHAPKVVKTLQRLRAQLSEPGRPRPLVWLHVGTGAGLDPTASVAILEPVGPSGDRTGPDAGLQISERARRILESLAPGDGLGRSSIGAACGSSHSATLAELRRLIARGLVERTGKASATRYRQAPKAPESTDDSPAAASRPRPEQAGRS
jgi:hypothetical protein